MTTDEPEDGPVLVLYSVGQKDEGEIEMEFDNGASYSGRCLSVDLDVVDAQDRTKHRITLIVPTSSGPALLAALLTEDQWEAVVNA